MRPRLGSRTRTGLVLVVLLVVTGGAALAGCTGPPREDADPVIRAYAEAWSNRDAQGVGELTDAPRAAGEAMTSYQRELGVWDTAVRPVGELDCGFRGCEQTLRVEQQIPRVGKWRYSTTVRLETRDGDWRVQWRPANYHPELTEGDTLRVRSGRQGESASAALLTAEGQPLADTAQVPELLRRLADRSGVVLLVGSDENEETLHRPKNPGDERIRLTLQPRVQRAAESALLEVGGSGTVVALRASTGQVLAAAGDGVFSGRYEPGPVFSVVSAAALIDRGLDTTETVSCPVEAEAGGTAFRNTAGQRRSDGPFWEALAWSCDTTVVARSDSLRQGDLVGAAARFGIGTNWDPGVPAHTGRLPTPGPTQGADGSRAADDQQRSDARARLAATAIGREGVTVSPLVMAGVAGTVSAGGIHSPYVVEGDAGTEKDDRDLGTGDARARPAHERMLGDGVLTRIRGLLRAGVTDGPAAALETSDHDVYAAVGQTFDQRHEWIIGYRGDLAFAARVPSDAVDVVERFLQQYQ